MDLNLAENLRFVREYRGYSLTKLSKATKIKLEDIRDVERGFNRLSQKQLKIIMNELKWNFEFFYCKHPNINIL